MMNENDKDMLPPTDDDMSPNTDDESIHNEIDTSDGDDSHDDSDTIEENAVIEMTSNSDDPLSASVDVDAALAAIGDLNLLAEDEQDEIADDIDDADYEVVVADTYDDDGLDEQAITENATVDFIAPPLTVLRRGQAASALPALLLIAVGAYLTFALSSNSLTLTTPLILGGGIGILSVLMLTYWWTSKRWSQGSLLIGTVGLAIFFSTLLLEQGLFGGVGSGWYVYVVAIAIALTLTGILGYMHNASLIFAGVILAWIGIVTAFVLLGVIPNEIINVFANLAPIVIVVVLVILIVPARNRSNG